MEKFNFNLQLFADDTQTSTETATEGTDTTSKDNRRLMIKKLNHKPNTLMKM